MKLTPAPFLLVLAVLLAGCGNAFKDVCLAVEPGERIREAGARLEDRGGRYVGRVHNEHQWLRTGMGLKTKTCGLSDQHDPEPGAPDADQPPRDDAMVVDVRYVEGHDLL